jgi:Ubiquitin carboxyl-terminal hydrolase/Zn-finger in ubiquitin-hydrolases and other protein
MHLGQIAFDETATAYQSSNATPSNMIQKVSCSCSHLCVHRQRVALLAAHREHCMRLVQSSTSARSSTSSKRKLDDIEANSSSTASSGRCRLCEVQHKPCSLNEHEDVMRCLQCSYSGCRQSHHIQTHLVVASHNFACSTVTGELYCLLCGEYVYDTEFDLQRQAVYESVGQQCPILSSNQQQLSTKQSRRIQNDQCYYYRDAWRIIDSSMSQISWKPKAALTSAQQLLASQGLRGMYNMGNTCFMSCVLQAFIHNPLLKAFLLRGGHDSVKCAQVRKQLPLLMAQVIVAMFHLLFVLFECIVTSGSLALSLFVESTRLQFLRPASYAVQRRWYRLKATDDAFMNDNISDIRSKAECLNWK